MNNFVNDYTPLGMGGEGLGLVVRSSLRSFVRECPAWIHTFRGFKCNLTKELPVYIFRLW